MSRQEERSCSSLPSVRTARARRDRAIFAAVTVARELGVRSDRPVILKDSNNTIVHLAPSSIVAKVGTTSHRREEGSRLSRELAVATYLAGKGAPIVPPSDELPPGPHAYEGLELTFWRFCDHDPEREIEGRAAGEALRALHAALGGYPAPLPPFTRALEEVGTILADGSELRALPDHDHDFLLRAHDRLTSTLRTVRMKHRPLHGEPHTGNLLSTPGGHLWIDFEAACLGPLEADLAALPDDAALAFPEADHELLSIMRLVSSLCVATWCWLQPNRAPEVRDAAHFHLARLRRQSELTFTPDRPHPDGV